MPESQDMGDRNKRMVNSRQPELVTTCLNNKISKPIVIFIGYLLCLRPYWYKSKLIYFPEMYGLIICGLSLKETW